MRTRPTTVAGQEASQRDNEPTRRKFTGTGCWQGLKSAHRLLINHGGKRQTPLTTVIKSCRPQGEADSEPPAASRSRPKRHLTPTRRHAKAPRLEIHRTAPTLQMQRQAGPKVGRNSGDGPEETAQGASWRVPGRSKPL